MVTELIEPKINNRYVVNLPDYLNIKNFLIQNVTLPTWEHQKWGTLSLTLLDIIPDSTTQKIYNLIESEKINNPFDFTIDILDPTGIIIEQWNINGLIFKINFGSRSYSNDDLTNINLDININKLSILPVLT